MSKIVDCFTFFNELDLLKVRLEYLYDSVDYFIIVESDSSHNGKSKEFNYLNNIDDFSKYKDKIIYYPVKMPPFKEEFEVSWIREKYQRICIDEKVKELNLNEEDFILISDLDEIPNKEIIRKLRSKNLDQLAPYLSKSSQLKIAFKIWTSLYKVGRHYFGTKRKESITLLKALVQILFRRLDAPYSFEMGMYYYYTNYKNKDTNWHGTQCVTSNWFETFTSDEIRSLRLNPLQTINNGGWHFSYLGGIKNIIHKLESFAHQKYNLPEINSEKNIQFCIDNGYSLFDFHKNPNTAKKSFKKINIDQFPEDLQKAILPFDNFVI